MKTKEELNALKEEVETLNKKLAELTAEELAQGAGGAGEGPFLQSNHLCPFCGSGLEWLGNDIGKKRDFFYCRHGDGHLTFFWEGARWERGIITD